MFSGDPECQGIFIDAVNHDTVNLPDVPDHCFGRGGKELHLDRDHIPEPFREFTMLPAARILPLIIATREQRVGLLRLCVHRKIVFPVGGSSCTVGPPVVTIQGREPEVGSSRKMIWGRGSGPCDGNRCHAPEIPTGFISPGLQVEREDPVDTAVRSASGMP
jgi:hypothetical protein